MTTRKTILREGLFYHIYNRGSRKSKIFFEDADYRRWETLLSWHLKYDYPYSLYLNRISQKKVDGKELTQVKEDLKGMHRLKTPPVEVLAYVEIPNHFHLLLKQITNNGITRYLHKVSTAFTMYINRKYDMSGSLFEGTFQSAHISDDTHYTHLPRYIHINPISAGITTIENLLEYPWSSLPSYIKHQNNPILTKKYILNQFDNNPDKLLKFTQASFEQKDIDALSKLTIDDDFDWFEDEKLQKKQTAQKYLQSL